VDIHHHLLFGMDDGARDRETMCSMIRAAAADGITAIIATPHAHPGVRPFDVQAYMRALEAARAFCRENALNMRVEPGAELLYSDHACRFLEEGKVPTLAGTDRVLVEFMPDVSFAGLERALAHLVSGGYRPVVAHAERYECLVRRPGRAQKIREALPVYYQINARTIVSGGTLWQRLFLNRMLDRGLIDAVATDAHNLSSRRVLMSQAYDVLCRRIGKKTADELTSGRGVGLTGAGQ